MSWKQYARQIEAANRRQQRAGEREAVRRYRELQKLEKAAAKAAERERAANEVARFENYLELLVSLHRDGAEPWDWQGLSRAPAPQPPQPIERRSRAVQTEIHAYSPGFFERLFGGAARKIAALENELREAHGADQGEYAAAVQEHERAVSVWNYRRSLAPRLLSRDPSVYASALQHTGAFDDVGSFQTRVRVERAEADAIALICEIVDEEIVPTEEVKSTAAGKLSSKAMATARYWGLYQDHLCSCALRLASEAFAALPIVRAVVNVGAKRVNPSTGYTEFMTLVAVHITRSALGKINLGSVDPSDSLRNFQHRMKFKKTAGFEQVEPISLDEQWVST